jgi:hypothetical protein
MSITVSTASDTANANTLSDALAAASLHSSPSTPPSEELKEPAGEDLEDGEIVEEEEEDDGRVKTVFDSASKFNVKVSFGSRLDGVGDRCAEGDLGRCEMRRVTRHLLCGIAGPFGVWTGRAWNGRDDEETGSRCAVVEMKDLPILQQAWGGFTGDTTCLPLPCRKR